MSVIIFLLLPVLPISFLLDFFPPFKMLIRICFFAIKKSHLERFILNDLISHKRQEPCSSYFFLPGFSETKISYLFYRHKYKSQNHNNTRYSMRQQFIFCILCYKQYVFHFYHKSQILAKSSVGINTITLLLVKSFRFLVMI